MEKTIANLSESSATAVITAPDNVDLYKIRHDTTAFPRLRDIPEEVATQAIANTVAKALLYRGQRPALDFVRFTAAALRGELMADLGHCGTDDLTLPELAYAIRQAVIAGDEMYGVNVASLYKAAVRYARGEGMQLQQRKPITQDELATIKAAYAGQMMKNVK